jgi:transaldolase
MTKIYCDIAEKKEIKKFISHPLVSGFTTNPTLMKQAGVQNYEKYCKDLLKVLKNGNKSISFEVLADDYINMKRQALKINDWGKNIYVKIPVVNSKGEFQGKLINELCKKKIKLNITAVFSTNQTKKILNKIEKNSDIIISIFAGRLGDSGQDPIEIFKKSIQLKKKFKKVKILWASTREVFHFVKAKKIKCEIITMPPQMIHKLKGIGTSSKMLSIKTVEGFIQDTKKANFKL